VKPGVRVCASFEEEAQADRDYWQQFSSDARVALIDQMREEWASMTGEEPAQRATENRLFFRPLTRAR
jgi:hypothetical protein